MKKDLASMSNLRSRSIPKTQDEQVEMQVLAIGVLVDFMKDLDRAKTYATQCDEKPVWSKLGKAVPFPETETETETETA